MNNIDFVILAAGKSSRMNSSISKFLHKIAGKPVIKFAIDLCQQTPHNNVISVVSQDIANHKIFKDTQICVQKEPKGTADAVIVALPFLTSEYVIILCGDMPFVSSQHIILLLEDQSDIAFFAMKIPEKMQHMPYGRVVLNNNSAEFERIIEYKNASKEEQNCNLCNSGIYKIKTDILKKYIFQITANLMTKEKYFTEFLNIAKNNGVAITTIQTEEYAAFHGINTLSDLAQAENIFQNMLRKDFMQNGVYLQAPETIFFSFDTKIERDVVIEPNVVIKTNVRIGQNSIIKSFCYLEDCEIKNDAIIGSFTRIRGGSIVSQHTEIGNFVEIKASTIDEKTKIKHLAYIGDTIIGKRTNIGAGTITCNYDGVKKHQTIIGDDVLVGSNCSLVAPIEIESNALIGAASVITQHIPANSLAISRPNTEIKLNGATRYYDKKNNK